MRLYKFLAVVSFFSILIACQQDDNDITNANSEELVATSSNIKSEELLEKLENIISRPTANGSLLLQSRQVISNKIQTFNRTNLSNKFDSRSRNKRISSNNLSIVTSDGKLISPTENNRSSNNTDLSNLFGTEVQITSGNNRSVDETVYVPDLLSTVSVDGDVLEVGRTISWNVDELNENGVLFYITYDPKIQPSLRTAFENQYRVVEAFAINDAIGSYTITQEDVERFPQNSALNITLMRGGFSINPNDNNQSFIAISEASISRPLVR